MALKLFNNGPLTASEERAKKMQEEAKKDEERLYQEARSEQQYQNLNQAVQSMQNVAQNMAASQNWGGIGGSAQAQSITSTGTGGLAQLGNAAPSFGFPATGYSFFISTSTTPYYSAAPSPPVTQAQIEELRQVEPRMAQKPMPDSITMITGYRAWRVNHKQDGEWRLKAVGQETVWEPKKKMEAACVNNIISVANPAGVYGHSHQAPQRNCTCGFWAFKSIDMLPEALTGQNYRNEIRVIGSVDLWGRVIETENGFRAQYAYPKELWLLEDHMEDLGWIYGVKIRTKQMATGK